jgi:hypothetical protein
VASDDQVTAGTDDLRYLDAQHVRWPMGTLAGLEVRTADDESLGELDGVLLDPAQRRLRFLVVQSPGLLRRRRYLLPVDAAPHVEGKDMILRVETNAIDVEQERFDARTVRPFSDEDVVTAMFATHAA